MRWSPAKALVAAGLLALLVTGCPSPGTDSGPADATVDADSAVDDDLLHIDIVNVSPNQFLYLDACEYCGVGWRLFRSKGMLLDQIIRPESVHCMCDDCSAVACTEIVVPPSAWIEIPPGESVSFTWDSTAQDVLGGVCAESYCLEPVLSGIGTYHLVVDYAVSPEPSENRLCPDALPPVGIEPYQESARMARCNIGCTGILCPANDFDRAYVATFPWPSAVDIRAELGE